MGIRQAVSAGVLAALAGCGGGNEDAGSGAVPVVASGTPSPVPSASPTPLPALTPASDWAAASAALYDTPPDVLACRAGSLKASVKADVLARLNAIRAIHRLPPVTYSEADDAQMAGASLVLAANGQLSHTPPSNWACWTAAAAAGTGSSNLYGGTVSPFLRWYSEDDYLGGWLIEGNSDALGHRRWMLDPFLGKAAYGRVSQQYADGRRTDAATLKVFDFAGGAGPVPTSLPAFVAWPYGDYPARYADPAAYLSFSVVLASRAASAGVGFGRATITVTAPDGTALAVTDRRSDNDGYGLPNNLQWRVTGLQRGVTYTVRITGVTGAPSDAYSYTFRIAS